MQLGKQNVLFDERNVIVISLNYFIMYKHNLLGVTI